MGNAVDTLRQLYELTKVNEKTNEVEPYEQWLERNLLNKMNKIDEYEGGKNSDLAVKECNLVGVSKSGKASVMATLIVFTNWLKKHSALHFAVDSEKEVKRFLKTINGC